MFVARDQFGNTICARCGQRYEHLTKDHFVPMASKMNVNEEGNLIGLCRQCNQEKGCKIVSPQWYVYLKEEQQEKLWRYLRYARHLVEGLCHDPELLEKMKSL